MANRHQKDNQWKEAKKRCRLNMEEVQMAKELGMSPRGLIKNIPSPKQQWKLPVKQWIRELHFKKFRRLTLREDAANASVPRRESNRPPSNLSARRAEAAPPDSSDDIDIPF